MSPELQNVLRGLIIFLVIVVYFMMHSLAVDVAEKKGFDKLYASLFALIPIYGFIYFTFQAPSKKNVDPAVIRYIFNWKNILSKFVLFSELIALSVVVVVPVIYIFGMAFSNIRSSVPNTIWPVNPTFDAFLYLFSDPNSTTGGSYFPLWYMNTLTIALINMSVGTVLITGAAYVFARGKFKGKRAGLMSLLVLQAFPSFMGLLAMYVLFNITGLIGRPTALSILYIGGSIPGNIWLIKGFLQQIPKDLDESALIDGANKLQTFFKIILPLAVPIISFVAVNMFMAPWMDYMLPGYLLNIPAVGSSPSDVVRQWTLAVGLFKFINDATMRHYAAFAAGAIIVGTPITVLYMIFQRYLIEGIMAGSTKG